MDLLLWGKAEEYSITGTTDINANIKQHNKLINNKINIKEGTHDNNIK
jgi:hypothetical protein